MCDEFWLSWDISVKPTKAETEADVSMKEAWYVDHEKHSLKLKEHFARTGGASAGEFHYGSSCHNYFPIA